MFIVEPFEKGPSIRSALGFMSLTSRWGAIMFPGITVLTRDFHDIWAMHRVIRRYKEGGKNLAFLKTREADDEYARELKNICEYEGTKEKFKQQMTYWQRYGSFVNYFGLFQSDKVPGSISRYREIVFDDYLPKKGEPSDLQNEYRVLSRAIRIENSDWYRNFRETIVSSSLDTAGFADILSNSKCTWWITGLDKPAKVKVPKIIELSRNMEFALTVWQTLFECAGILLHKSMKIPRKGKNKSNSIETFLRCFVEIREGNGTDDTLFELAQSCLDIHETFISKSINHAWEKEFRTWLSTNFPGENYQRFTMCHNPTYNITKLARADSKTLLDSLSSVHRFYCELQRKPSSISVRNFSTRELGEKIPDVSAIFGGGRWGLFGYRLEASVGLYLSKKYEEI